MITTKVEANNFINQLPDVEFKSLCSLINSRFFSKSIDRLNAEKRFVKEVSEAEEAVRRGHFVTSEQLHDFLGV